MKANRGLGGIRIARELSSMYGLNICPGTINHWIYGDRRPRLRNIFPNKPSPALSYIIGSNKGDGCTLTSSGSVKLEVTDLDFAQTFNTRMAELFSRNYPNKILVRRFDGERLPLYIVKYTSRQLVELLRRPMKELIDIGFVFPSEFLRGFFDAEGHVSVAAGPSNSFQLKVGAENSNRRLLEGTRKILWKACQIHSTFSRKRESGSRKVIRGKPFLTRRTSFDLSILRLSDVRKFEERIGFSIIRKNQKLRDALMISERYRWKERSACLEAALRKAKGRMVQTTILT
ncbi:MAG: hypothetical protein OK452_07970 [Thaumarchaeota archaeon]|nr:hypothetical protein [Nitrososphaerota archaeon]